MNSMNVLTAYIRLLNCEWLYNIVLSIQQTDKKIRFLNDYLITLHTMNLMEVDKLGSNQYIGGLGGKWGRMSGVERMTDHLKVEGDMWKVLIANNNSYGSDLVAVTLIALKTSPTHQGH